MLPIKSIASSVPAQHSISSNASLAKHSSTVVTKTPPPIILASVNTLMDFKSSIGDQQTSCDRPQEPRASSEHQISAAEPPSGDQPTLCEPLPGHQTSVGSQQPSIPLIKQLMSHPDTAPPSEDQPMLCGPLSESQAFLGGQQSPSASVLVEKPVSHPEAEPSSNSLPDPQAPVNDHPISVFISDDIPEQAHSTMHLQDVLGMWYGFTYSPSSKVAPQMNAPLSSFTLKICEGTSTLPGESSLCITAIAFLKKLMTVQPPDPALCDLLNDSLLDEYLRSLFTI